tara:strand:+ start:379 stop:624 length:246 start_codon:yes stop_codon:yes gene_type:complete
MEIEEELQAMRFMYFWTKNVAMDVPLTNGDLMAAKNIYLPEAIEIMKKYGRINYADAAAVYSLRIFCENFRLEEYTEYFVY